MPRTCSVCVHPSRTAIEREIVAGEQIRRLAVAHGLAETSLRRHRDSHLRKALARALEKGEVEADADRLITWTHTLHARTLIVLERAERLDDLQAAARLVGEARKNLELLGRIAGVLEGPKISIDARKQFAVLSKLDENALRALASGDVVEGETVEEQGEREAVA